MVTFLPSLLTCLMGGASTPKMEGERRGWDYWRLIFSAVSEEWSQVGVAFAGQQVEV